MDHETEARCGIRARWNHESGETNWFGQKASVVNPRYTGMDAGTRCETQKRTKKALFEDYDRMSQYHETIYKAGVSHLSAFQRIGLLQDISTAIDYLSRALQVMPRGHKEVSLRYAALGMSYTERFRRLGQLDDLGKAIKHNSLALEMTPDDHPSLSRRYTDLGASYGDRYQRLGQLDDLEKAIEHNSRALALAPDNHPDMPRIHAALGASYGDRFQHPGELDDLEKANEHDSRALLLTPEGHPSLADRHAALGVSYKDRYRRLGELDDLEKAHEHDRQALTLTPAGHPSLADRQAALGVSYRDRYRRLGELDDIEKSIEHFTHALILTPEDHPSLSDRHAALGMPYHDRFRCLGELSDLEKASKHGYRALALTPDSHPNLPNRHFSQARTFLLWHQHAGDFSYLRLALESFRKASQILTGSPRERFHYALYWANLTSKYVSLDSMGAYQTTINLLPQFVWLGATAHQRYQDLSTAENLAKSAASVAILHSDPRLALEWLEHTRCVVWNQTLMLRSPIGKLHSSHPDLASRLQVITKQLDDAEQVSQQRRRLAMEYDNLLAKTRMLPGFEDFLQPMKADKLVCAARYGPIIVINCHEDRCDALLILPRRRNIQHLPLPNFTQEKAQNVRAGIEASLRRKGLRERGVRVKQQAGYEDSIAIELLTLWNDVVKPVLDFLGYMSRGSTDSLPHVTWCPTGVLSFLPLHAAGNYGKPGSRVFDHIVSSYIPTVNSFLASTPRSLRSTSRVLAVGQEHTPGRSPLPGITKEIARLRAHAENKVEFSELVDNEATTTDVLDAMDKHDWVHLACHAHQNIADPTKSGFFLHDGTLDLAAINRRSFKNKGLAFLSACQTAMGDEKLPDEAIHLASGMLMAGYPSVIGTMWSVSDSDAPFVADKVYGQLMKDGKVGSGEAGRALHYAVGELRNKIGEKEFARWVPYIHIGS